MLGKRIRGRRPSLSARRPSLEELEPRLAPSVNVLTYHGGNASTGQDLRETTLTPANVNPTTFGKLFSAGVDGQVYAQPLYMSQVTITGGPNPGVHNVVFLATEHDSVFALDADTGAPLWQASATSGPYLPPGATVTPVPSADVNSTDITPEIGVTSTPVIDPGTDTLYFTAKTKEVYPNGDKHYVYRLHALDVGSGAEKLGGPVVIADTIFDGTNYTFVSGPFVHGTGDGNVNDIITFNALVQLQRPALTLADGRLYLAFGSHGDKGPYHGWVLSYGDGTLKLNGVLNVTPNGSEGGIWEGGGRVDVDDQGNLYLMTGNGSFANNTPPGTFPADGDYGDSFVKVALDPTTNRNHQNVNGWGLEVVDFFTPHNQNALSNNDEDLGSGGVLLLPDSAGSTAHPHLLLGAGKQGVIYLIDRDNMGKFDRAGDHVVQERGKGVQGKGSFDTPAFLNRTFYYVGNDDVGRAYAVANAAITGPTSKTADGFGRLGSTPMISANDGADAIVWGLDGGTNELRAYRASDFATELYTSAQAAGGRDALDTVTKFSVPLIANGKVYVGTEDTLFIFGLLGSAALPSSVGAPLAALLSAPAPRPGVVVPETRRQPELAGTAPALPHVPASDAGRVPGPATPAPDRPRSSDRGAAWEPGALKGDFAPAGVEKVRAAE